MHAHLIRVAAEVEAAPEPPDRGFCMECSGQLGRWGAIINLILLNGEAEA